MKFYIETDRLILRDLLPTDEDAMFEMDSDPEVHKYLGNKPVQTVEEIRTVIANVRQQYVDNGIGRWALVEKESGNFMGWSGLRFMKELTNNHIHYLDIGYRLAKKYWGKGYATESAKASLKYGFDELKQTAIYGVADVNNKASRNALEKSGLRFIEKFERDGMLLDWLEITKKDWEKIKT